MRLRTMTPADRDAYRSILARTSDEDRYYRFFRAVDVRDVPDFAHAVADSYDKVGFLAESDGGAALGAAHAAILDGRSAELAIVVAEGSRERGVGHALVVALITYLRDRGIQRFVAHSLQENAAFARLAASVGLRIEHVEGADIRWALDFSLVPAVSA